MHTYVHIFTYKERGGGEKNGKRRGENRRGREREGREKEGGEERKGEEGREERGKWSWYSLILMSSHRPVFESAKVELEGRPGPFII